MPISHTEKATAGSHLYAGAEKAKFTETESRTVVGRGSGVGKMGDVGQKGTDFQT